MTVDVAGAGPFQLGRVLGASLAVMRRNLVTIGMLTLLLGVLPGVVIGLLGLGAAEGFDSAENIVVSLTSIMLQSAIYYGVLNEQAGRRISFGASLSQGAKLFLPMFGVGFLAGLGFVLGLILLIIPGLMIATAWAVAGPVRVAEGPGVIRALKRSQALTKGNRWRVFGLFVLVWGGVILLAAVAGGVLAVAGFFQEVRTIPDVIFEAFITALATAFPSVVAAMAYLELRNVREGGGSGALAEIFA